MPKKKVKRKMPVIEAKGIRAKAKRKSKPPVEPWEVWTVPCTSFDCGHHSHAEAFKTKKKAELWVLENRNDENCQCPVIVYIDIPPMEY